MPPQFFGVGHLRGGLPIKKPVLTPKQKAFIRFFTSMGDCFYNGTKSAKYAGYTGNDRTLAAMAAENLRKPHIAQCIREQIRNTYASHDITIDRVLNDLEVLRCRALATGDLQVAFKCTEAHGKYLKMFADRVEHLHTIEDVDISSLIEMAQNLGGKIDGININRDAGRDAAETGAISDPAGNPTTH